MIAEVKARCGVSLRTPPECGFAFSCGVCFKLSSPKRKTASEICVIMIIRNARWRAAAHCSGLAADTKHTRGHPAESGTAHTTPVELSDPPARCMHIPHRPSLTGLLAGARDILRPQEPFDCVSHSHSRSPPSSSRHHSSRVRASYHSLQEATACASPSAWFRVWAAIRGYGAATTKVPGASPHALLTRLVGNARSRQAAKKRASLVSLSAPVPHRPPFPL